MAKETIPSVFFILLRSGFQRLIAILLIFYATAPLRAQLKQADNVTLQKKYDLSINHSRDTQYFFIESKLISYSPDGTRQDSDVYRVHLRCVPGSPKKDAGDEYTCLKFTVQFGKSPEVSLPSLANWKYIFKNDATAKDENGPVLGIDHSRFENLVDSNGNTIPIDKSYHIYNAFIDFHSVNNVFAEKTLTGSGIQDLTHVGEKIIHGASFSEPAVDVGKQVKKGSVFKNGQITLEFKGLGFVNKRACAILGYDSGESSFTMLLEPMPSMLVSSHGSSHYWGDIYKDLTSGWIQKAILIEMVVSETAIPGQANTIKTVIERNINITNVGLHHA